MNKLPMLLLAGLLLPMALRADATATAEAPDADDLVQQGLQFEKEQKLEQAVASFKAALQDDPDQDQAALELGRCYARLGWRAQALEQFKALVEDAQDTQAAEYAKALQEQGRRLGFLPPVDAGPFSLQALAGYGWGFDNMTAGRRYGLTLTRTASAAAAVLDYADINNITRYNFQYSEGEGALAGLEALYAVNPGLSFGLLVMPLKTSTSFSVVDQAAATTTTVNTDVTQLSVPLLLNAHTSTQLSPRIRLGTLFGVGPLFPQPYMESTSQVLQDKSLHSPDTTSIQYQRDYAAGVAFLGGLEASAQLSPHLALSARCGLLIGHLEPTGGSYSSRTVNSAGKVIQTTEVTDSYVSAPPAAGTATVSSNLPSGATAAPGTYSMTWDNGPTHIVETRTYGAAGALASDDLREANQLSSGAGTDDINYKQLSAMLSLQWEF
jgi:hypothetical protein